MVLSEENIQRIKSVKALMKRAMTKEVRRWRWWIGAVVAVTRRGRSPSQGLSQRLFIPPSSPPSLSPPPRQHHPTRHHTRFIPVHVERILISPHELLSATQLKWLPQHSSASPPRWTTRIPTTEWKRPQAVPPGRRCDLHANKSKRSSIICNLRVC